ncbi:hypothetical protein JTB14_036802 [Gonioctena quinquepunctata]|nr:hypothetical protein JTB14_036802 [Gonioctena quinquepunctata]
MQSPAITSGHKGTSVKEIRASGNLISFDDPKGQVISYLTCKVRDPDTEKSLGPHQVGESCFRVMKGYYKNPEATLGSFTSDGWFGTGDLGYYDDDELLHRRQVEGGSSGTENNSGQPPRVLKAGVVGLPNQRVGELLLAFVVNEHGVEVSEEELQEYVAGAYTRREDELYNEVRSRMKRNVLILGIKETSNSKKIRTWLNRL